jgi:glucokinase
VTGREMVTAGIDIGGTGTRIALIGTSGQLTAHRAVTTESLSVPGDPESSVRALARLVLDLTGPDRRIASIGIGASGPVGTDGIIRNDDTLPAFSHFPVAATLSTLLRSPCTIDNDAVTAATGEYTRGAGRGSGCLMMATLGTGVGLCVLNHGQPHRGGDGLHPEAGHLPVPGPPAPCYCGLPACWEQKASRTALARATQSLTGTGTAPPQSMQAAAAQAREGDQAAQDLFCQYGNDVGQGLAALTTIFRPDRVVIGGSTAAYLDLFLPGIQQAASRRPPFQINLDPRAAELGDLAGAIGAAELARTRHPGQPHDHDRTA